MPSLRKRSTRRPRRPWWQQLLAALMMMSLLYVMVCVYSAHMLLTPDRVPISADNLGGIPHEDVAFPAFEDSTLLRGWFLPAPDSKRLIIMVHGIQANRAGGPHAPLVPLMRDLTLAGYNVLTFDLRGHGTSEGRWTSLGAFERRDVLGAIAFARARDFQPDKIGVVGYSLGGASVLSAAGEMEIGAVAIDSAFSDLREVIDVAFPLPRFFLPGVLLAGRLAWGVDVASVRPADAIGRLGPIHALLIHGAQDSFIAPEHMQRLQTAGGTNVVRTWLVPQAGHVGAYSSAPADYLATLLAFFDHELAGP